ncbi:MULTISPECIES: 30S ribosomal protein S17 [Holospora]|uniref:Small ribosomal subunit protein uS17 n=2 Tax=Holospora TaxID=44747 RepID=A0A061JHE8_9PROT|nr:MULTISPECIES: 30S ribosomal protein S17 [Holospora]ETZ04762.1 30S ribosomal protein S17 [Holospora undulata HU1]GAJ46026.1 30S ribosomal protein S17 [Holospora elegans E1]
MAKRQFIGQVVNKSSDKTVMVLVHQRQRHPLYHKEVLRRKKYMAHDEKNEFNVGQVVLIEESRPFSKRKSWVVLGKAENIQ